MKKIIAGIFAISVSLVALTLDVAAQTTSQQDYDYATKGYRQQVESGHAMQEGYSVKDLGTWSNPFPDGSRGFHFIALYRGSDVKPCAVIAIYELKDATATRNAEYYCIPTPDATAFWEKTQAQLNANLGKESAGEILAGMSFALMRLVSIQTAQ